MTETLILGAGVMGTAFGFPLAYGGHVVRLVGTHLDQRIISSIQKNRVHPGLKLKIPENIVPYSWDRLEEAMANSPTLIVIGVSSPGVNWAVEQLGPHLTPSTPLLMLTKGLVAQEGQIKILPHMVKAELKTYTREPISVGGVGGPCIAGELAAGRESSVVISFSEPEVLSQVSELINAPYYHVCPSTDIIGVELCAAFKNFYALAVGAAAGLLENQGKASNGALMHNLTAGLFTQALLELSLLTRFMGGRQLNVVGLAGSGDLYVTCQAGRNSRMGRLLGLGLSFRAAKKFHMPNDTVEGADLALAVGPTLLSIMEHGNLDIKKLPLAKWIIQAVCHNQTRPLPWGDFYAV